MMDLIKSILASEAGSFGFIFSIMLLIAFVIFKIGQWYNKIQNTDSTIKELKDETKSNSKILSEISGSLQFLKDNIQSINNRLMSLENKFAKSQSPISLTEDGKNVANKLSLYSLVDKYLEKIEKYINKNSAYDIQESSFNFVNNHFYSIITEEELQNIKNYAYNQGDNINDYDIIIAIIIRDKILEKSSI